MRHGRFWRSSSSARGVRRLSRWARVAALLAIGATGFATAAVALPGGVRATAIAAGATSFVAIGSDHHLYAWGMNSNGEIGDGTTTERPKPVRVKLPAGSKNRPLSRRSQVWCQRDQHGGTFVLPVLSQFRNPSQNRVPNESRAMRC